MTSRPDPTASFGELITVTGVDGSSATIARHGGHLVSWRTADGRERLFVSDKAVAATGAAIRGGVPVCFPQFAGLGPLPKHGFARTSLWTRSGPSQLALDVAADEWPGWPHACSLTVDVLLGPGTLTVVLGVTNRGGALLSFTGALHTYLACADVTDVVVSGLDSCEVHGGGRILGDIGFGDGQRDVDLSVLAAPGPVRVGGMGDGAALLCAQTGFADVVVWNVGASLAASMGDLGDGQWRQYVCVEAAAVGEPVVVEPSVTWRGSQTLVVL